MTIYKIISPSDPYHLTADDLVLAAIAACLLGHGKYALEATDGSEGVPLFLFGGHDEWFAAQGAGSFDEALTAATGQRAEALAKVLESVSIVGTRSSLNDIGEAAARLAVGVRKMVAQSDERTPYDAMGPVDAPNPPAARAPLADVQPGGRVRLGDALPPLPASSAHCPTTGEPLFSASKMTVYAQASVQAALSAQPSPGGQGDAPPCWWIDHGTYGQITQRQDEADAAVNAGKRVVSYVARQPVGEPPMEMRICELRHVSLKPNRPYIFTVDANCANCRADAAYAMGHTDTRPAQAADLGQLPRAVELLSNVSRTLVDWAAEEQREAIGIVKALIDSQAVGNG